MSHLNTPLTIGDLLNENGTTFEVDANFDESDNQDEFDDFLSDDDDFDIKLDALKSPWESSFDELREQMFVVNEFMYKSVIKEGYDNRRIPTDTVTRVVIHYNGFFEKESTPFDSSYLRGKPFTFNIGQPDVLPGLNNAVLTMKVGEKSQFLISYELLFKELGCPPRVPPKADGLFVITLSSFTEVGNIDAADELNEEDKKKFAVVLEKAKATYLSAMDAFKSSRFATAKKAFHRTVQCLEFCQAMNEDEDKKRIDFLVKLYRNLAVTYNKLNQPKRACTMCKELRRIEDYSKDCKGMFQEGRALAMLGDFPNAKIWLTRAQVLEPNNPEISRELKNVCNREQMYRDSQKDFMKRAFGVMNSVEENAVVENSAQKEEFRLILKEFKDNSDLDKFTVPTALSAKEIDIISSLTEELGLKLTLDPLYRSSAEAAVAGKKKYIVLKNEQQ